MRPAVRLGFLALLLSALTSLASEPDTETFPDYGTGIREFEALGFPSVTNATYINLNIYNNESYLEISRSSRLENEGNAWLIHTNDDGTATVVYETLALQVKEISRSQRYNEMESSSNMLRGSWAPVDLEEDIDRVLKNLDKLTKELGDSFTLNASMLFFAMHIYQAGHTNTANQIIDRLIQSAPDPHKVIQEGLDRMADQQYGQALRKLYTTKNWSVFANDLSALLDTYTTSWEPAPGARILHQKLQEQSSSPASIQITNATPAQITILTNLLVAPPYTPSWQDKAFWQYTEPDTDTNSHPFTQLKSLGIRGVPLYLQLLTNDTFTTLPKTSLTHHYSYFSSDYAPEDIFNNTLSRPATLGDIAKTILMPIQPGDNQWEVMELTVDAIYDNTSEWYQESKDQTPEEIALSFLTEGTSGQQESGAAWLLKNPHTNAYPAMEAYFMEHVDDYSTRHSILSYVASRETPPTNFINQVVTSLAGTPPPPEDSSPEKQQAWEKSLKNLDENIRQFIVQLRSTASRKPIDELLDDIAHEREPTQPNHTGLASRLRRMNPDKSFSLVLNAATVATNLTVKNELLSVLTRSLQGLSYAEEELPPPDFVKNQAQWKLLLEQFGKDPENTADLAMATEYIYNDSEEESWRLYGIRRHLQHLGIDEILTTRLQERLSGKDPSELSPLPQARDMPGKEIKALLESYNALDDDTFHRTLKEMPPDLFLALENYLNDHEEMMTNLLCRTRHISYVSMIPREPDVPAITALLHATVDAQLLDRLDAISQELMINGSHAKIVLRRCSPLSGYRIDLVVFSDASDLSPVSNIPLSHTDDEQTASITYTIRANDQFAQLTDFEANSKEAPPNESSDTIDQESSDDLDLMDEIFNELEEDTLLDQQEKEHLFNELKATVRKDPCLFERYDILVSPASGKKDQGDAL